MTVPGSSEPADWAKISDQDLIEMAGRPKQWTHVSVNLAIWIEVNEQKGRVITTRHDETSQHVVYEAWDPPGQTPGAATSLLPDH